MNASEFQRARRPEQKEERRTHLLNVTRSLLSAHSDIRAFGLNELARQAEMAKSNVYRYFESREALLLALLQEEWSLWYRQVERDLRAADQPASVDNIALLLARNTAARPLLGHLTSVLPSIIEHNVSLDRIRDFKAGSLGMMHELAISLRDHQPSLSVAAYEEFMHQAIMLMTGLWPLSHPSSTALEAIQTANLAPFQYEFERDFARGLTVLLRGLTHESAYEARPDSQKS